MRNPQREKKARLPNLREASPSKIAAGFGGTLNLVLSAGFILATVLATAVPAYFWLDRRSGQGNLPLDVQAISASYWLGSGEAVILGLAATVIIGVATTVASLRCGFRAFRSLEF